MNGGIPKNRLEVKGEEIDVHTNGQGHEDSEEAPSSGSALGNDAIWNGSPERRNYKSMVCMNSEGGLTIL